MKNENLLKALDAIKDCHGNNAEQRAKGKTNLVHLGIYRGSFKQLLTCDLLVSLHENTTLPPFQEPLLQEIRRCLILTSRKLKDSSTPKSIKDFICLQIGLTLEINPNIEFILRESRELEELIMAVKPVCRGKAISAYTAALIWQPANSLTPS